MNSSAELIKNCQCVKAVSNKIMHTKCVQYMTESKLCIALHAAAATSGSGSVDVGSTYIFPMTLACSWLLHT